MLPLECLDENLLTTLAGPLTPPVKHFQLKRKPKSATLWEGRLQKSLETVQQLKRSAGVPFMPRAGGRSATWTPESRSKASHSSSEAPPAPTSWENSLQATRAPEEPSTLSPTLPAQFKQRAPMYNSSLSPAVPTPTAPTLPLTPTTPPAVTPAPQMPLVAMVVPQTQPPAQQRPKKLPFMRTHARSKGMVIQIKLSQWMHFKKYKPMTNVS
ncbi:Negative elongation factor A [Sciurus carolinensis]|uniref:Negative elongation factor A n=1 Tax=Sciurus carolinensis TaxID=30640 RepID=A0AA41MNC2_SCICA|nr:Negative elongation factor A [Sciurus carolinensis]